VHRVRERLVGHRTDEQMNPYVFIVGCPPGGRRSGHCRAWILEVYLNVIEWGEGLYGVEAAAERYFGVSAAQLDARQSALLAAALPDPRRSNPAAPSRYLAARAAIISARAERVRLDRLGAAGRTGAQAA